MNFTHRPEPTGTILAIVPHYPPAYLGGGPPRTLEAMVRGSEHPDRVRIVTSAFDHGESQRMEVPVGIWHRRDGAQVHYVDSGWRGVVRTLLALSTEPLDFIYLNSLFNWRFALTPLVLRRLGWQRKAQFILAPRGELDPGALVYGSRKKSLYIALLKSLGLLSGISWHASAVAEARQIASLGSKGQTLIKENETLLPMRAIERTTTPDEVVRLVYVGRISPKKRLENLLDALATVDGCFTLEVVGRADDSGYQRELERRSSGLASKVRWAGARDRDQVMDSLRDADLFCFPTAGENFGHVVAEALSQSCPVMVADVTPWSPVVREGGGVLVGNNSVAGWAEKLQQFVETPPAGRLDASRSAAAAYDRWRERTESRTLFDYLLSGRISDLAWKDAG